MGHLYKFLVTMVLLVSGPALAQQAPAPKSLEDILKEQLGELAFLNAALRVQVLRLEPTMNQLNQCQAKVTELERKLAPVKE